MNGKTAVLGTAFDIANYNQTERVLYLNQSKNFSILESFPDAVAIVDSCECITLVNKQVEDLFGFSRNELLSKSISLLLPSYKQQTKAKQKKTDPVSRPYFGNLETQYELNGSHKEGYRFPVAIKLIPLELEEGLHDICVIRDITYYKRAEKQTFEAEHLAILGRLVAVLAHEMNNCIQLIDGHIDLIVNFELEENEVKHYLQLVWDNVEQLKNISQRVLNYTNPHSTPYQRVFITELIEQILIFVKEQLHERGIHVITHLCEAPPVMASPNQMMQVFLNLIINALEAVVDGGLLSITQQTKAEQIFISFQNDGPAIPPSIMPHIFEPFFSTKPGGNGLGLWVSYNLVRQHNGSLTARNLPNGQGVEFTVMLPAIMESEA